MNVHQPELIFFPFWIVYSSNKVLKTPWLTAESGWTRLNIPVHLQYRSWLTSRLLSVLGNVNKQSWCVQGRKRDKKKEKVENKEEWKMKQRREYKKKYKDERERERTEEEKL